MQTLAISTIVAIDDLCFRTSIEATNRLVLTSQKQRALTPNFNRSLPKPILWHISNLNNTLEVVIINLWLQLVVIFYMVAKSLEKYFQCFHVSRVYFFALLHQIFILEVFIIKKKYNCHRRFFKL